MKELYTKPELEIELFQTEDVITASDNEDAWMDEWNKSKGRVE